MLSISTMQRRTFASVLFNSLYLRTDFSLLVMHENGKPFYEWIAIYCLQIHSGRCMESAGLAQPSLLCPAWIIRNNRELPVFPLPEKSQYLQGGGVKGKAIEVSFAWSSV